MLKIRCIVLSLVVLSAAACGGKAQEVAGMAEGGGNSAVGGASFGGAPSLGGMAAVGGSAQQGGSAGAPTADCFSVSADSETNFAAPGVVADRLTRFILEQPDTPALPQQTTRPWAADLAKTLLTRSAPDNPAFARLFAGWFSSGVSQTTASQKFRDQIAMQGQSWGAAWAQSLSPNWDMRPLFTGAPGDAAGTAGMLTDHELLALYNHLLWRGFWVTSTLMCLGIPPEPTPPPSTIVMTRSDADHLSSEPACGGCHNLIEPAGLAFENFDQLGNRRTTDVDTSGSLPKIEGNSIIPGDALPFTDITDLGNQLSTSCDVAHCIAQTLLAQALTQAGVDAHPQPEEIQRIANQFARSRFSGLELVQAIATSPSMLR